ncbi:MAG: metallophosphoesterase [Acidobacteriota bacterium]
MSPIKNCWCGISLVALALLALPSAAISNSSDPVETPDRVVAIGDIHGEFEGFTSILRASELVDDSNRWIGGTAILVQTGDYMDRGPDVRKVMDLLMDLQTQAAAEGGQVIVLMGNHESMNLLYDYRDVTDEIFASFATDESDKLREEAYKSWVQWMRELARTRGQVPPKLGKDKKEAWMKEHPPGYVEYERAIGPNGMYGQWLLDRPVAARVGNTLYMHAGLSEDYVGSSIEEINQLNLDEIRTYQADRVSLDKAGVVPKFFNLQEFNSALYYYSNNPPEKRFANPNRQQLIQTASDHLNEMQRILVEDSPLWYRGYTNLDDAELEEHVARLKKSYGVEHFVVAHSPLMSGRIHQRLNGTVFLIDTGMLTSYYKGRASALEFDHGRFSAIYQDSRVVLRESDSAKEAVPASASADHSAFRGRLQPVPAVWRPTINTETRPAAYPPQAEAGTADAPMPKRIFVDIEGNPLPFQTPDDVEDFLRSAKMVSKENIPIREHSDRHHQTDEDHLGRQRRQGACEVQLGEPVRDEREACRRIGRDVFPGQLQVGLGGVRAEQDVGYEKRASGHRRTDRAQGRNHPDLDRGFDQLRQLDQGRQYRSTLVDLSATTGQGHANFRSLDSQHRSPSSQHHVGSFRQSLVDRQHAQSGAKSQSSRR